MLEPGFLSGAPFWRITDALRPNLPSHHTQSGGDVQPFGQVERGAEISVLGRVNGCDVVEEDRPAGDVLLWSRCAVVHSEVDPSHQTPSFLGVFGGYVFGINHADVV